MKVKNNLRDLSLSIKTMGNKSKRKANAILNMETIKKVELDINQVKCSDKDLKKFVDQQNNMNIDTDSDDSDSTVVNKNVKEVNEKSKMAESGNFQMADNELYKYTDNGPYYVIGERQEIDEFKLCDLFMQFKAKDIINVNKISNNKVRILTKTYTAANSIIKMGKFQALSKYKLYIPINFVFTDGIVRNIPLYYETEQIKDIIKCKVPIVNIERLNFWNKLEQKSQPSNTIKIRFRSATVPENVNFMWLLRKVELFVPKPFFCQICLKYGHFKKYCNPEKNEQLCRVCAKPPHNAETECTPSCKQCKVEHITADRNCPTFKYQCDIKRIMALKKISYNEAKEIKGRENPTPATSNNNYKKTYADIVASTSSMANSVKASPVPKTLKNPNNDTNKEKELIIAITKMIENMGKSISPGNNDELLINIGQKIHDFWKVPISSEPTSLNE